jgi:hypothetical protein
MRLVYPPEQPKVPFAFKLFFGAIAAAIFAALGGAAFIIFIIMADPHDAGETFGEVAASIVNGFKHTLED